MTGFADQVRIRLISHLLKGISRVFHKLLSCFNGKAIFTFVVPALLVLFKNLGLNLTDLDSVISITA